MIGRAVRWAVALLLLISMGVTSDAATLTITSMDWSVENNIVALSICVNGNLQQRAKLTVTNSGMSEGKTYFATIDEPSECAQFSGVDYPFPDFTTYQLETNGFVVFEDSGSVAFALGGNTISCGSSKFQRLILEHVQVDGIPCLSSPDLDSNVCYILDDSLSDFISFTSQDSTNPGLTLSVPKEAFSNFDKTDVSITADAFEYETMSFTFSYDKGTYTLVELLKSIDGTNWNVSSCSDSKCSDDALAPSREEYNFCGVFNENNNLASGSVATPFQDLKLIVESTTSTIDFYFANLDPDCVYTVHSVDNQQQSSDPLTLDCTHIEPGDICNGFFLFDAGINQVSVAYDQGGDNEIIALFSPQI